MNRIRGGRQKGQGPRVGVPDAALTPNAGLAAVTELCGRLGVIEAVDAAVGPVKQRDRGFGAGELLCGIAAAQLAGEDFLTGLDRQRADAAGQLITPVPGLASTTAAGLARRVTPAQWEAVERGLAAVTGRMLDLLPAERAAALAGGPVTIDLDATDVEVYGRKKRGVAYNHQGQRVGRPHVAAWAETEIVLAADLGDGTDDPRATAPGLLRRALACLPAAARAGRVALRADAGYFAGALARAAHDERIAFAIGANPVRRQVARGYDAAVPELSAGHLGIPDLPWASLSHRQVLAYLTGAGWVPCGVGDWAVALRSPAGHVAARVCPFDPAYWAFVDLCRECAGNRWLPRIDLAADLEGGGSVVFMEFVVPVGHPVVKDFAEQWQARDGNPEFQEVSRAAQRIHAEYRKSMPWWGRCDLDDEHIFSAAGRPVLLDVFCMAGSDLYQAILDDVAAVYRRIPRERMRYALDIPYIARENSAAEILALRKAWARGTE